MSRHLKRRKRDLILDRVDRPLTAVLRFFSRKANDTKTYFRETPKKEIFTDFLAHLAFWSLVICILGNAVLCFILYL